jgi:hypothetical protein
VGIGLYYNILFTPIAKNGHEIALIAAYYVIMKPLEQI